MSVSVKKTAPPAVALAGQQRGALLKSLSRVLPSGLARRVLAAGDADRQRIERDLHDGVQQRLTGLRIRLALAAESFQERGDTDASAALNGFDVWCDRVNRRVHRTTRAVSAERLAEERARMCQLPNMLPDTDRRFVKLVPAQPYLRFDRNDYSIDPAFARRRVEVRVSQELVTAVVLETGVLSVPAPSGIRREPDVHRSGASDRA